MVTSGKDIHMIIRDGALIISASSIRDGEPMNWIWNGLVVTTTSPGRFTNPKEPYRGACYGRPWPGIAVSELWAEREKVSQAVEGEPELALRLYELINYTDAERNDGLPTVPIFANMSLHPAIVPDIGLVERYIESLTKVGISVRMLLCATTSSFREMDPAVVEKLLAQSTYLGIDYVEHDFNYSPLADELNGEYEDDPPPWLTQESYAKAVSTLERLTARRNSWGLLETDADLEAYIAARWQIACPMLDDPPGQPDTSGACRFEVVEFWPCKVWEVQEIPAL